MSTNLVKNWFGESFTKLHPKIQYIHLNGGSLRGNVNITFGKGLAGAIGKRLAKKLNIPNKNTCSLEVNIFHSPNGLHWNRCFDNQYEMQSIFKPVGHIKSGYWIEKTGLLTLHLNVEIKDGGWHW